MARSVNLKRIGSIIADAGAIFDSVTARVAWASCSVPSTMMIEYFPLRLCLNVILSRKAKNLVFVTG